jgi:hypothetical protein
MLIALNISDSELPLELNLEVMISNPRTLAVLPLYEYAHACTPPYISTAPNSVTAANWTHVYMTFFTQNYVWNSVLKY